MRCALLYCATMADTENLAILLTDMVGFTERSSSQSRADFHDLLKNHDQILKDTALLYSGEWVKSTGDGMLVVFRSPTNAVQCGMAMQDALAEYNHQNPAEDQIHIRVAVNLGEVRREGNSDIFGEAVNVTARIESLTPTDQVYFTQAVYLAMNKAEVPSERVGSETLKGIPEPVDIYRVPAGQAMRLVTTGEPMQGEGVPYPFGGMPHARLGGTAPTNRGRTWRWAKRAGMVLLVLFVLAVLARRGEDREHPPALPASPAATTPDTANGDRASALHTLNVHTRPETARVRILNIKPAYTPDMALQPGRYHVEVALDGYQTDRRWIDLERDTEITVALTPVPVTAKMPETAPPAVTDAILRRNDMFLTLSGTVQGHDFYLQRHPHSDWAEGIRVANQNDRAALQRLRERAEANHVEAQLTLGWLYFQGKGVRQSAREGAKWMELAYRSGDPLATWFRGMAAIGQADRPKGKARKSRGLEFIQQAADRGEPLGELSLGIFHANGEHVQKNDQTAVRWLRKAVDRGMPFAESMLAGMYLEGRGVDRNLDEAVRLLRSSAARQDPTGQYYLGLLHEKGFGVKKDAGQARRLYRAAADAGYAEATRALNRLR